MIIVITNRKLPEVPTQQAKDIRVAELGVVLGDREDGRDSIYTGSLSHDGQRITFYPRGKESALFANISNAELNQPWVFFVHGFHQDADENMGKARALASNHAVNVIVFAWPSRPLDETYDLDDAKKDIVKDLLVGAPVAGIVVNRFKDYVLGFLKDMWKNYPPAIQNAENSAVDLIAAIKLVGEQLNSVQAPVLLVHSMGNYLLENTVKQFDSLPMKFSNIVLHQADVNCPGYDWVEKLLNNLDSSLRNPAKLFITTNTPDYVLGASCLRRTALGLKPTERLGQTRHHYLTGDIHYLDFTDGPGVDVEHEFFKLGKDETNEYVYDCLGRIFRGEADLLPGIEKQSNMGFTKMPTAISLYWLKEIIDPVDTTDDEQDNPLVDSLSWFTDPLAIAPELEFVDDGD